MQIVFTVPTGTSVYNIIKANENFVLSKLNMLSGHSYMRFRKVVLILLIFLFTIFYATTFGLYCTDFFIFFLFNYVI